MSVYEYQIYGNGELVNSTPLKGIAWLEADTLAMNDFYTEIHEVYTGDSYDPVLHGTRIVRKENPPPCPEEGPCKFKKSKKEGFLNTTRPTALRTEPMCPQDRCGWMLRPSCLGGTFFDYSPCIGRKAE